MGREQKRYRDYLKTSDGAELFYEYEDSNQEKTLIFINGLFQCVFNWYPLKKNLMDNYNILAYDLRGQGKSKIYDQPITLDRMVLDLDELITHLGLKNINLIGISLGSIIASLFSANYKGRVDKLVLLSPLGGVRFEMILEDWKNTLELLGDFALFKFIIPWIFSHNFIKNNEKNIQTILDSYIERNDMENLLKLINAIIPYPKLDNLLREIDIPYTVIVGGEDALLSVNMTRNIMESLNKTDNLVIIPGVGHSLIEEAVEEVGKTIKEFV